jgi:hypothetical protein
LTIIATIALVACDSAGPISSPTIDQRMEPSIADAASSRLDRVDQFSSEVSLAPRPPARIGIDLCGPIATATCRMHLGCRTGVTRDSLESCEASCLR